MIYSLKHNFIFISNPKTGSTTIEKLFKTCLNSNEYVTSRDLGMDKHVRNYELRELPNYLTAKKFVFIRNPWERTFSWFTYLRGRDQKDFPPEIGWDNRSIYGLEGAVGCFETFVHTAPGWVFANNYMWCINKFGQNDIHHIGTMENFTKDVRVMMKHIGIQLSVDQIPHDNKSVKWSEYKNKYNTSTKKIIAEKFKIDIDLFKFKF